MFSLAVEHFQVIILWQHFRERRNKRLSYKLLFNLRIYIYIKDSYYKTCGTEVLFGSWIVKGNLFILFFLVSTLIRLCLDFGLWREKRGSEQKLFKHINIVLSFPIPFLFAPIIPVFDSLTQNLFIYFEKRLT